MQSPTKLALFLSASAVAVAWAMPPVAPAWDHDREVWEYVSGARPAERN